MTTEVPLNEMQPTTSRTTPSPAIPPPPPLPVSAGSSVKPRLGSAHPRRKSSVQLETKSEADTHRRSSFRSSRVGPIVEPIDDIEEGSFVSMETVMETPSSSLSERMPLKNAYLKIGIGLIAVVILLVIILVPLGYHELEYYEMGLYRNKMTGFVDTSKTYFSGRHWLGVNKNFVVYPADLLRESYSNVSIFTTEKLEVNLTFSFSYQLRHEDLGVLYETFGDDYKSQLNGAAFSALKGAAIRYSIDDFKLNRPLVAKALSEAISLAIGGKCCRKDCFVNKCGVDCKIYWSCVRNDFGYFSVLRYFQMQGIDITEGQSERYLKQVLEKELEDKELFQQDEEMVRLETEQLAFEYKNKANEMIVNATANSTVFKLEAIAESEHIIEDHRNRGLRLMYEKLNVTEEEHKKQLDYVMSIKNQNKASLYLDFQYVVARP